MIRRSQDARRGVTLMACIAVLAVLSALSITFVRMSALDRGGAANHVLRTRARMLATGGVHRAVGVLARTAFGRAWSQPGDPWIFRTDDGSQPGHYPVVSLETARYPSLAYDRNSNGVYENGGPSGSADLVHGRAVSGVIDDAVGAPVPANYGATYEPLGNSYVLRIRDLASKLDLNSRQANLPQLLDTLGEAIAAEYLTDPINGMGAQIVGFRATRPGEVFTSTAELETLLGGAEPVRLLSAFVTCHATADPTARRPQPSIDPAAMPAFVAEPRAAVNVNTAPKPLLHALFVGLHGYELRFVETDDVILGSATVVDEKALTTPLSFEQAGHIADALIAERATNPFRTWSQLHAFVTTLPTRHAALAALTPAQLDCIRANANPNTLISRFNPADQRAFRVDKMDLMRYSTELCFAPDGAFEIESLGRITARGGQEIARARVQTVVRVWTRLRHTTQREFETHRLSSDQTVSYPESIADTGGSGSDHDGQIEMFTPPAANGGEQFFAPYVTTLAATVGPSPTPQSDPMASGPKTEGASVFAGSDLMPDGMLSSRRGAEELWYDSASNMPIDQGTVEFWVKLVGDGTMGSNESLMYMVKVLQGSPDRGLSNKLERFGDQLINSRFYWTHPPGGSVPAATSPFPLSLSRHTHSIAHWKPHEWHHIAIVWFAGVDQRFYVDGVAATSIIQTTRSQRRFYLASNDAVNEFSVGGYVFDSLIASELYGGPYQPLGKNERFSNSTISGFRVHPTQTYASSFAIPDRFSPHPISPSLWHGRFPLTRGPMTRIGVLRWTEYQPTRWGNQTFNADPDNPDTDIFVEYRVDGGAWTTVPNAPASGGDGRGVFCDLPIPGPASGSDPPYEMEYRLTFSNPGGISPMTVTPVLDAIEITVLIVPQFLAWTEPDL